MKPNKVAFIFHPLDSKTALGLLGIPKVLSRFINKTFLKKILLARKPFIYDESNGLTSKTDISVDLMCVVCPLLPEQLIMESKDLVKKTIKSAINLAVKKGANFVVLAGYTSIVTNQGMDLIKDFNVTITTGNTYTVVMALKSVTKAVEILGKDLKQLTVVIVGSTGDIGSACARWFAGKVRRLYLVARDTEKQKTILESLKTGETELLICHKAGEALPDADVIIAATSSISTLIDSKYLKKGCIVCDVSLPPNIARDTSRTRNNVLSYEGGLAKIPFYEKFKNTKLKNIWQKNAIHGCLAEGLILGLENKRENFSLGRGEIDLKKLNELDVLGIKHGLETADFFCGQLAYDEKRMSQIRSI